MRILVTGRLGQVTTALQRCADEHNLFVIPCGRPELDLANPVGIEALLDKHRPDLVVSSAAYTAVDLAEDNAEEAMRVNAHGPAELARETALRNLPILHLSTDYVFDGSKPTPYIETDPTGPIGVYGATKLAGEQAVASANPRHVIVRTAWVYSEGGSNFLRSMLRLAQTRKQLSVVSDQFGCPTYAHDLAIALVAIAQQVKSAGELSPLFGTFHGSGQGDTSWAEFAEAIFAEAQTRGLPYASVLPIPASDYPTRAKRPTNSRLDCTHLADVYGVRLPAWHEAMTRCLARIAATA